MTPATGFHLEKKRKNKMEDKIQLIHPTGKHAIQMDIKKYNPVRRAILKSLSNKKAVTHKELLVLVIEYFKKKGIKLDGSVEWYMEGVKLDRETKNLIQRIKDKSQLKFQKLFQKINSINKYIVFFLCNFLSS